MDIRLDLEKMVPFVIDMASEVLGEDYRNIISDRLNSATKLDYCDVERLNSYLYYIQSCKSRELGMKFLKQIGVNVTRYERKKYVEELDKEIKGILKIYTGTDEIVPFYKFYEGMNPILLLEKDNLSFRKLDYKLQLINYLRANREEQITKENIDEYMQTKEYKRMKKRVHQIAKIYHKIIEKYQIWERKLQPYRDYVEIERKRKKEILERKQIELFKEMQDQIPEAVCEKLIDKPIEEQIKMFFGAGIRINDLTAVERFSKEKIDEIKNPEANCYFTIYWQLEYLMALGVIPNDTEVKSETEEERKEHLEFLNKEEIKKYIPSESFLKNLKVKKEEKLEEANKEYYTESADYKRMMVGFADNENNRLHTFYSMKDKKTCIMGRGGTDGNGNFISILFYTILMEGRLDAQAIHEFIHVICQSENGCGLEPSEHFIDDTNESFRNPYNKKYRKYERLNEALTDICAIEITKRLHENGIYLLEPEKYTKEQYKYYSNTSEKVRNLLGPFVKQYKDILTRAMINANQKELTDYIGKDNFEELVDAINKIDSLWLESTRNLENPTTEKEKENFKEYLEQIERIKQIYIDMEEYYGSVTETKGDAKRLAL